MKIKAIVLILFTLLVSALLCGCGAGNSPYRDLDSDGATVSVKYLAGEGGMFAGTGGVTVVDVFNLADYESVNGKISIPLIAPDDERRGQDAFEISRTRHVFAGWFVAEPLIEDGNVVGYKKGERWDFDKNTLTLNSGEDHSSSEPVLTLIAGWMEYASFEIYDVTDGDPVLIGTYEGTSIELPEWNLESGKMYYKKGFPELDGKTFLAAYLDSNMTIPASDRVSGNYDFETGELTEKTIKIYTSWREGEWYRISNVGQLTKLASVRGCYELTADLDFSSASWPKVFADGEFKGKFIGGGHTVSGIKTTASITKGGSVLHGGVFGSVGEDAEIRDVTFDNVTYTLKSAAKAETVVFGLFTGECKTDAISGVTVGSASIILTEDFALDFRTKIESDSFKIYAYGIGAEASGDVSVTVEGDSGITASVSDDGSVLVIFPEE